MVQGRAPRPSGLVQGKKIKGNRWRARSKRARQRPDSLVAEELAKAKTGGPVCSGYRDRGTGSGADRPRHEGLSSCPLFLAGLARRIRPVAGSGQLQEVEYRSAEWAGVADACVHSGRRGKQPVVELAATSSGRPARPADQRTGRLSGGGAGQAGKTRTARWAGRQEGGPRGFLAGNGGDMVPLSRCFLFNLSILDAGSAQYSTARSACTGKPRQGSLPTADDPAVAVRCSPAGVGSKGREGLASCLRRK